MEDDAHKSEVEKRRDLVRFSKWLSRLGFTPGTSGNLSIRLDEHRLLVTPTGMSKQLLKATDMVLVDLTGKRIAGSRNVTSEISMHLAVYQSRADVSAVVHAHPPIATAFACSGRALNEILCQEAVMTLGKVPLAEYATTGTSEVAASLLRWPEGWEPQLPATFIPVAEEAGLIVPIGAWVLKTACHEAAAWTKPLKIAVNLSPLQFSHGDIVGVVDEALKSSGLDPERLELEVTESLWLQNTEAVLDQLGQLRSRGISIALDDFGTGYSSLSYLWKFPFDKVKVDRSFVTQMEIDPKAAAIVDTVVALGRTLDLTITAEGVETKEQAEALKHAGCDQGQGYLFGRPLSAAAAIELINSSDSTVAESPATCAIYPWP